MPRKKKCVPYIVIILGSFIFLVFLGYYFCHFVPEQKKLLTQRYLRVLAMMSTQMENRWDDFPKEIEIPNEIPNASAQNNEAQKESILNKIKDQLQSNLKPFFPGYGPEPYFPSPGPYYFYDASREAFIFPIKTITTDTGQNKQIYTGKVNVPVKVRNFIRELFWSDEFDDVLLCDDHGYVLYMRSYHLKGDMENGIKPLDIKEFLKEPNAKNGFDVGYTRLLDVKVAGFPYKLFIQPIFLKSLSTKFENGETKNQTHLQIVGVLASNTFANRAREIPIIFLLLLFFLFALTVLIYPLVKLSLIGPRERVRIRDILGLALAIAVAVPIITLLILTVCQYSIAKITLKTDFESLANSIHDNFSKEIKTARDQLVLIEKEGLAMLKKNAGKSYAVQNLLAKKIAAAKSITYPYFDEVFILDNEGHQRYKGVIDNRPVYFKNVSYRDYFKKIKEKFYWYTTGYELKPIVLEPGYSPETLAYELILAIPPADEHYAAVVMKLRPLSVLNPLIPNDYGFAVIDRNGKVIFHNNNRLNLYENFFSECRKADRIKAVILNKARDNIHTEYQGKKQDIYIRPMTNIPWTIIIFKDRAINDSRSIKTLANSFIHFIHYFLILIMLYLIFLFPIFILRKWISRMQKTPYHKGRWIWPNKGLRFIYSCLAFFNLLCFVILMVFSTIAPLDESFLLLSLANLILTYLVIRRALIGNRKPKEKNVKEKPPYFLLKKLKHNIIPMFFLTVSIIIFCLKCKIYYIIIIILLYNAFYFLLNFLPGEVNKIKRLLFYRHSHTILCYSFVLLLFVYPSFKYNLISQNEDRIVDVKYHQLKLSTDYSQWLKNIKRNYAAQEQVITQQWGQRAGGVFADQWGIYSIPSYQTRIVKDYIVQVCPLKKPGLKRYTIRIDPVKSTREKMPMDNGVKSISKKECPIAEITAYEITQMRNNSNPIPSTKETRIFKGISTIIPIDTSYIEKIKYLYMNQAKGQKDYPLKWGYLISAKENSHEKNKVIYLKYLDRPNLEYNEGKAKIEPVYFISTFRSLNIILEIGRRLWTSIPLISSHKVSAIDKEIGSWLWVTIIALGIFMFILFNIIYFSCKAIFLHGIGISPYETAYILNTVDEIKKLKGKFLVFGNAPSKIKDLEANENYLVIDLWQEDDVKSVCEKFPTDKSFIVVTHFDYMRHDPDANQIKLDLLERAVYGCNTDIILYSQFEPLGYFNLSGNSGEIQESKAKNGDAGKSTSSLRSWERLLRQFEFKYPKEENIPDESSNTFTSLQAPAGLTKKAVVFINSECNSLDYLKPLKTHVFSEIEKMDDKNLGIHVLKDIIFEHAKPTYDYLWRTSTKEEKLVMTQLSRSGLLNYKNRPIIRQLLKRELITLYPLRLFNTTFAEYVNSAEDLEEILKWEATQLDSNWTAVRNPLLFLLMGLIIFLVISQPNTLNVWLALIPALTGFIPFLMRLLDQLFGFGIKDDVDVTTR